MKEKDRHSRIVTDLKLKERGATLGERLLATERKFYLRKGGTLTPLTEIDVTPDETLTLDPEIATMQDRRNRVEFERLRTAGEPIPETLGTYGMVGKRKKIKFGTRSYNSGLN